jgi:spore maturation protein CgeB
MLHNPVVNIKQARLLYFGDMEGNSGSRFRELKRQFGVAEPVFASRIQDPFMTAPRSLRALEWRLCNGPYVRRMNHRFYKRSEELRPDIVWVEMGKIVYARTLSRIKERFGCLLVNTYSDDFLDLRKRSRHYFASIPSYDLIFTPRDVSFNEYRQRGARVVDKFWKGYDPDMLFPDKLSGDEMKTYGTDVMFAGHYEPSRTEPFLSIAEAIPRFKIWGQGWKECHASFPSGVLQYRRAMKEEYRKAICGAKIAVQFLTRWNRDTQTSRSFEIPACGTMMLAERSDDHEACFEEDKEAVFFSTTQELVDKAKFYLKNDSLRQYIARGGYKRSLKSGYANSARTRQMLRVLVDKYAERLAWNPIKEA